MKLALAVPCVAALAATAASQTPLLTLHGMAPGSGFGSAVAPAGDLDRDGVLDFIVGAPGFGNGAGIAVVISGRSGSPLRTFVGSAARSQHAGNAVDGGGDVDADGVPDFIVGMSADNAAGVSAGHVEVYSGRSGAVLYAIDGDGPGDAFGTAVAFVGDVDGDGQEDFAAGAPENAGNPALYYGNGYAKVFSGRDGHLIYEFRGAQLSSEFGSVITRVGDLDRDGKEDFGITSYLERTSGTEGSVRVYSAATGTVLLTLLPPPGHDHFGIGLAGPGDVDGDGVPDVVVGSINAFQTIKGDVSVFSGRDGHALHRIPGGPNSGLFGLRVVPLGDVDGDGRPDFGVSDPGDASTGAPLGSMRIFSGRDAAMLAVLRGDQPGGSFGVGVASLDLNGDGALDVLVGSPSWSAGGPPIGQLLALCVRPTCTFGSGCGNPAPHLLGTQARLGTAMSVLVSSNRPRVPGVLLASAAAELPTTAAPGCLLHLDPRTTVVAAVVRTDAAGSWAAPLAVPATPSLVGAHVSMQALLGPVPSPLGFEASNGLYVTVTR